MLEVGSGDRVLDLACGHGRHARAISPGGGAPRRHRSEPRVPRSGSRLRSRPGPRRPPGTAPAGRHLRRRLLLVLVALHVRRRRERSLSLGGGAAAPARWPDARPPRQSACGSGASRSRSRPGTCRGEARWRRAPGTTRRPAATPAPAASPARTGSVLAGVAHLRYYSPEEWQELGGRCGLRITRITSTLQADRPAERLDDDAPDLIALREKVSMSTEEPANPPHPGGQARPRRPRPRRQDHRPGAARRGLRGHLHRAAPDPGDDRRRRDPGGRGRRRPLHHVRRPHDPLPGGGRGAEGAGLLRRHRCSEAASSPRRTSPSFEIRGWREVFLPGTTTQSIVDWIRGNVQPRAEVA